MCVCDVHSFLCGYDDGRILHVEINSELGLYIRMRLFYMARVNVDAIRVLRGFFFFFAAHKPLSA